MGPIGSGRGFFFAAGGLVAGVLTGGFSGAVTAGCQIEAKEAMKMNMIIRCIPQS